MHYTFANKNLQAHADMHEGYKVQMVVNGTSCVLFRHTIFLKWNLLRFTID